jgi:hypothetical protein
MAKPAVNVVIAGDTKKLEKSLKDAGGALGGFKKTAAGVFGGLALAKGVGLAVDGIQALGNFALDGVGKLDELGDGIARLDGLAKGLGDTAQELDLSKFGVDKGEQVASATAIAKTAAALGLTDQQLVKITPNLQTMAAQLASLGDGDPAKQAELLAKALGGSSKAAKTLGVQLPKGGSALENYQALVKKLGPQLDKATSGQASLADVGERWDATLANLQLQLAGFLEKLAPVVSTLLDKLLPVFQQLVDTAGPLIADVFQRLSDALTSFMESGGATGVADVMARIGAALSAVGGFIAGTVVPAFEKLVGFVIDNVLPVFLAIADGIAKNVEPLLPKIAELADALFQAFEDLLPILEEVWGFIGKNLVPILVDKVFPVLSKIAGIVLDLATAFVKNLVPAIKRIGQAFTDVMQFLQPVLDALGSIAGLAGDALGAVGGIFRGAPATAGAAAVSRTSSSAGITVNVNTGVGDPVAIGRTVARYLRAYELRGGTVT